MLPKAVLNQIRALHTKKNGELKRLKKPNILLEPLNARRKYTGALYRYTFQIRKAITEQVLPKLPFWLSGGTITYPDPVKADSLIDMIIADINGTFELIIALLAPYQEQAIQASHATALEVAGFNQRQYYRSMKSVLGVDIFLEEPWLEPQLELFANQNAQLIKNMTDNEMERAAGIVQRAIQEGANLRSTTENIQKKFWNYSKTC